MFEIVLLVLVILFFIYELSCIHVPKNFEAPLSYRVSTVLIKIVTLMVTIILLLFLPLYIKSF